MLTGGPATVATVVAAVLVLGGALWVLVSAVAMHRVTDALSRVNALGPATGVGLPWIVVGAWLHSLTVHPFAWLDVVKVGVTVAALLVVSSVASNALSRAAVLSGAEIDPRTAPNDLLDP
ncbi:monovalent cation/H(+) antiporter subunit G [Janibacter sp. YIM B02568]|nr:monovalent cation/H(+) antiporter subunit G [Janibacter endophyticus]